MKANTLIEKSIEIESLYEQIEHANDYGQFKIFVPHYMHVSSEVKLQLIEDGFKVYIGDWDANAPDSLIIEW